MIKHIKIGAIRYTVELVNKLLGSQGDGTSTWLNGRIQADKALIEIEDRLPADVQRAAAIHETCHGILEQAGIEEHPEQAIIALGYGWLQVLRDNPELVKWLTESEER